VSVVNGLGSLAPNWYLGRVVAQSTVIREQAPPKAVGSVKGRTPWKLGGRGYRWIWELACSGRRPQKVRLQRLGCCG
jgi:hypothetical protein